MKISRVAYRDWQVDFVYAPFFEMFCSLHVLFHAAHHKARKKWAIETEKKMDPELYKRLAFYDIVTEGWMGAMEISHLDEAYADFNVLSGIRKIETIPNLKFADLMLNRTVALSDLRKILVLKKCHIESLQQEQVEFLLDVESYKDDFISALKAYFYLHFQEVQIETEAFMISTLKAHKKLSESMDFIKYLELLHPRIESTPTHLRLHKFKRFDYSYDDIQRVEIGISTFIDPHLLVGYEMDFLRLTIRAKIEPMDDEVHDDLIILIKALGDKTRLKILKCLYEKPWSTQALAEQLSISEAGISKQLKILNRAYLVRKIRQGNFILYYINTEMIDRIPMNVYQYLDEK
ncbi:ArsR/SmtB family transcription factor [Fusibacter ferrireducens]|uniref:Winged helix-turn-helix transcriptional regulator n=1 Tax=Fusibacter ferrireducens TaxID=2785058 RepID=A0ABR9ZQW5_9FIRM|nr:metalloregulator ArsR/SmtB family transcription factor [Fusibacter ferrireducens]MBF4692829.1 winged helix-turn-helix transcriptional regulator [Fusibacter ferrireducens]